MPKKAAATKSIITTRGQKRKDVHSPATTGKETNTLSTLPKASPVLIQRKKKGKESVPQATSPPLSPDNVNVEKEKRD